MKKVYLTTALKRPYMMPQMHVVALSSTGMLAQSTPKVYTSSEKASTEKDALTKESNSIWDESW